MSLNIADILDRIVSHAMTTGLFERVNTHEPKNSPGNGLSVAIWADRIDPMPEMSGLQATTGRVTFMLRIYSNMLQEPQDMIDPNILKAVDTLMDTYSGDFELGGKVKHVDLLGISDAALSAQAGYLTIGSTMYRVMTITVPVIINDIWNQVA